MSCIFGDCLSRIMSESMTSIFLSGLGSGLIATLIIVLYELRKKRIMERNLYRGFISELQINKEYLKHNFDLAGDNSKPPIFVPLRYDACARILTSGEIKLEDETREKCNHYLVTVDHLNRMLLMIGQVSKGDNDHKITMERIKRYCRSEVGDYGDEFDFVRKHLDQIQVSLIENKNYLKYFIKK